MYSAHSSEIPHARSKFHDRFSHLFSFPAGAPFLQNRIRYFRKQRGLTLEALGAAIGLTPQSLSRIENGKMRLSTDWLARIAAALRISPPQQARASR
ncbi:MAG TPA: hypothetical protein DCO82_06835, partial [Alphaproteobacteria bacterium]|nr:hypothetical protein [Alphaproteobacteria bacterium]